MITEDLVPHPSSTVPRFCGSMVYPKKRIAGRNATTPRQPGARGALQKSCRFSGIFMTEFDPTTDLRVLRDPTVYLVGRQTVNDAELDRFLADHGVSWQTDTEVAGEHLTEAAGRVCYMSFAKPRPGGNRTYLGHILEVGHGSVLEHAVWNFL